MTRAVVAWLIGFVFTQAIEVPIYMRVTTLRVAFLASTFTHPIVWFVFPAIWPGSYLSTVIVAEVFAVAVEAAWLHTCRVERALLWSFIANAASFCIGMALRSCFGVP